MIAEHISNSNYNLRYIYNNYSWFSKLSINDYPLIVFFWNLFLLLIPYFLVFYLIKYWELTGFKKVYQKIIAFCVGFIWLIFIPNTAYIITDIRHINNSCFSNSVYMVCSENAWMIMFLFAYAVIGWVAFVFLLNQMKNFIGIIFDKKIAKIFINSVIPLIAWGVLLGLLNRWNSWEIFIYPLDFFSHALLYFTNLIYFTNWLIFTIFLYILYYGGNYLFRDHIRNKTKRYE